MTLFERDAGAKVFLGAEPARRLRRAEFDRFWIALACEAAGRILTRAEWQSFFGVTSLPYRATCGQHPAAS